MECSFFIGGFRPLWNDSSARIGSHSKSFPVPKSTVNARMPLSNKSLAHTRPKANALGPPTSDLGPPEEEAGGALGAFPSAAAAEECRQNSSGSSCDIDSACEASTGGALPPWYLADTMLKFMTAHPSCVANLPRTGSMSTQLVVGKSGTYKSS
jgi:hypothetical protein